jgi:ubiquinone/menaquinone biosynthesis C-methylase UbiE
MSYPQQEALREHPSTYIVQDRSNPEEIARLEIQERMLNTAMGGPLPELADHAGLRRVLDVGCGTGGWLMETARTYPTIEKLVGADISRKMLTHASAQAKDGQLDQRVQFQIMDALRILDFPTSFFDLVNQRFGASWVRTYEWTKLLVEYQRVTRPGGIIRITEGNMLIESNSPTLTALCEIVLETCYRSGRLFAPSSDGVTRELVRLMTQHRIEDVQTRVHSLVYRAGTEMGQYFYEDMRSAFRVALPFFQKWTNVPSNYQEIYQRALKEMQLPDFVATWTLVTTWGTRPLDARPLLMRGTR